MNAPATNTVTLDELAKAHLHAKALLASAKAHLDSINEQIIKTVGTKDEGSFSVEGDNYKITTRQDLRRSVDPKLAMDAYRQLPRDIADAIFDWKPSLNLKLLSRTGSRLMAFSLASIQRNTPKAPRILVHGMPGVGKTTFACGAPDPIVLQTEDGLGALDVPCFPLATEYSQVMEALGSLYQEGHQFKTLVVDSLDWLEPIVWQGTCDANSWDTIEQPYGKGYVEALTYWRRFFQAITALRDDKGMAIVMIAHSEIKRVEDPTLPTYDRTDLKMHKRASALAEEYCDVIGLARMQVATLSEDKGFNAKRTRATTTGARELLTVGAPGFLAKNRYGLTSPMPLSWQAFSDAMAASINPQQSAPGAA